MRQIVKTIVIITLYTSISSMIFSSCRTADGHLRAAKKHLRKAEALGAKWERDTIWKEVIVPKTEFDTVLQQVEFRDTITVTKDRIVTKIKVNTVDKTIYVNTECPPDTIRVPEILVNSIVAPKRWHERWEWILIACMLTALTVGILMYRRK